MNIQEIINELSDINERLYITISNNKDTIKKLKKILEE